MASLPGPGDPGGSGLLRGARTRSYGSLVQSPYSPAMIRKVEHPVQPGDTLQGLALKYGVTMEQIKRANRLYTNDSIFLKKSLCIPVPLDPPSLANGQESPDGSGEERLKDEVQRQRGDKERSHHSSSAHADPKKELSASDFLTKLDTRIRVSKRAATKKLKEGDNLHPKILCAIKAAAGETEEPTGAGSYQGPRSPRADSPGTHQRSLLGPVPLTITTRASTLKDHEDEIFKL
ncbi:LOW QUALITY PROTEIN: lysM and putative peptidoglycan-binding domain-containing protein 1 [Discoglossus pictus]